MRVREATKKGYVDIPLYGLVDLAQLNSKTRRGRYMNNKSNCLTTSMSFYQNMGEVMPKKNMDLYEKNSQGYRVYSVKDKSVTINAKGGGMGAKTGLYKIDLPDGEYVIRKLTPVEAERLQTLPDNYTEGVSNTQRYKQIGNGWTVDVIAHILSFIPKENEE